MAVYITGDTHGDYRRFSTENFPEQKTMTKDDCVIICGDFGLWSDDKEQRWWIKWLEEKPFTTLWVDGNHENYDLLQTYPAELWHGGLVQKIMPSVIHLMRGQVYEIEGKTWFTFGGARSHDIQGGILRRDDPDFAAKKKELDKEWLPYRIEHESWWKEELPSEDEMQTGLSNLQKAGSVDYIVTHCTATSVQNKFSDGLFQSDILTDYLQKVEDAADYGHWVFGHYHDNRNVDKKHTMIYEQTIRIV